MNTSMPLVSIVINNYNYGRFLRAAIDSALNQTYPNAEVIVVDDGSSDSSREILATYGNRVISVLKENGGQASAFNAGFAASKGEWIHLLDSDDIFHANKLERVSEMAAAYPSAGLIAHNLEYCTADGAPLDFISPPFRRRSLVDNRQRVRRGMRIAPLPATSGLCIRRDVLGHVLPMPEEIRAPDAYLRIVAASLVPVLLLPEALAEQRIHGQNFYTLACEDPGKAARFHCAAVGATVTFHLRKEHPPLARMAWKQYGYLLYQFRSCRTEESRAKESKIRDRYSVIDYTPSCIFYVAAVFTKTLIIDHLQKLRCLIEGLFTRWPIRLKRRPSS
jgi:glycosyltransferase involved in cell wall biosynthesis